MSTTIASQEIVRAAQDHAIGVADLLSRSRKTKLVRARWQVMRALDARGWSSMLIARHLNCHHTTVLHGLGRLSRRSDAIVEALKG